MTARLRDLRDAAPEGEVRSAFNEAADRLDVLDSKLCHALGKAKRNGPIFVVNGEAGGQSE